MSELPFTCPVCRGTGVVSRPPWVAGDVSTWLEANAGTLYTCRACKGRGIVWKDNEVMREQNEKDVIQAIRSATRTLPAKQEIAKTQFYCGHEATLLEYANEVSSLRIERDALLAVTRQLVVAWRYL